MHKVHSQLSENFIKPWCILLKTKSHSLIKQRYCLREGKIIWLVSGFGPSGKFPPTALSYWVSSACLGHYGFKNIVAGLQRAAWLFSHTPPIQDKLSCCTSNYPGSNSINPKRLHSHYTLLSSMKQWKGEWIILPEQCKPFSHIASVAFPASRDLTQLKRTVFTVLLRHLRQLQLSHPSLITHADFA